VARPITTGINTMSPIELAVILFMAWMAYEAVSRNFM
jgi:hypothetical protein